MNISPKTGRPKITVPDIEVIARARSLAALIQQYFEGDVNKAAKEAEAACEELVRAMQQAKSDGKFDPRQRELPI